MKAQIPEEPPEPRHAPELERHLLKSSVHTMASHRRACSHCGRSPLVGERLQVFATAGGREHSLCDLCAREEAPEAGEPLRMELVWPAERPLAIRRAA